MLLFSQHNLPIKASSIYHKMVFACPRKYKTVTIFSERILPIGAVSPPCIVIEKFVASGFDVAFQTLITAGG